MVTRERGRAAGKETHIRRATSPPRRSGPSRGKQTRPLSEDVVEDTGTHTDESFIIDDGEERDRERDDEERERDDEAEERKEAAGEQDTEDEVSSDFIEDDWEDTGI